MYEMVYDSFGNSTGVTAGNNTLATYEYYPNNGKLKKINYGNGFSEEYVYNTLEMLSEIWYTYSNGTEKLAFEYSYNYDGTISEIENCLEGKTLSFNYDQNGRLVSTVESCDNNLDLTNFYEIFYDADNRVPRAADKFTNLPSAKR